MQDDFDDDLAGDACDADDDADGVADAGDLCPATVPGDVVQPEEGCSLEQLCPCEGPMGQSLPWSSPGQFVRCVSHHANEFYGLGLISNREMGALMEEAARSECGASGGSQGRQRRHGWCERRHGKSGSSQHRGRR
jgi:hypothetical protein